jgi:phosphoenolpyruvate carboxykinase (GTP)
MRRDQPQGVPISAFLFGGRREKLAPLVYQAFDWPHGVYVGATMSSEVTAAQSDSDVDVRYDPMAMRPFCGYPMADYLGHWLGMEKRLNPAPQIFHVNWFRKDEKGKFLWPGFGDNLRVLEWVVKRCLGKISARETPIGYMPGPKDIDLTGLKISPATMKKLLAIDKNLWLKEMKLREKFLSEILVNTVSVEIFRQHERVLKNLRRL